MQNGTTARNLFRVSSVPQWLGVSIVVRRQSDMAVSCNPSVSMASMQSSFQITIRSSYHPARRTIMLGQSRLTFDFSGWSQQCTNIECCPKRWLLYRCTISHAGNRAILDSRSIRQSAVIPQASFNGGCINSQDLRNTISHGTRRLLLLEKLHNFDYTTYI